MGVLQGLVERDLRAVDRFDRAFFSQPIFGSFARAACSSAATLVVSRGDDYAIAYSPAGDGFGKRNAVVPFLRRRTELKPRPAQRRAMKVHASGTADDRRARLLIK